MESNSWREVKLSDLGEVARGRSRHRPRYAEHLYGGKYPFIQTGDVKASEGRISSHEQTYSDAGLAQSRLWPADTMCITIAANIAETGILQYPACFPDSVIGFIADKNKADVYFIEYVFRQLRKDIQRQATGSVQDNINLQTLERLRFKVPSVEEQKKIANFLNCFDDKITLNRQINQTLEQMAQALFKSWFVDFDPVVDNALDAGFFEQDLEFSDELLRRAEARKAVRESVDFKPLPEHIRQLFPAAFEKCSEPSLGLGSWVPEGWKGLSIKSHCAKIQNGGTPSRSNPEYWDDGNIPWLTSGEVRQSIITSVENTITEIGLQNSSAKWVGARSTLVALYGATAGEVSINSDPLTTNQAVCALIPKENYCWLNYLQIRNKTIEMQNNAVGSAQQNISKGLVENLIVISPPLSIVEIFHQKTESLFVKAIANNKMVIELARLRDTLLPKLISGELRLSGSEVDTAEEVLA